MANQNFMGKGDKKTKRGKIIAGSFGVTRPRKVKKEEVAPVSNEGKSSKGAKKGKK